MIQLVRVVRLICAPYCFRSFSCRYRGADWYTSDTWLMQGWMPRQGLFPELPEPETLRLGDSRIFESILPCRMGISNSCGGIWSLYRWQEWNPIFSGGGHIPHIPDKSTFLSEKGWLLFSTFSPLKRSSCVTFFLRGCSRIIISSLNRDGSWSISIERRDSVVPECYRSFFRWNSQKNFW